MKTSIVLPVTQILGILGRPIVYYPVIGAALGSMDAAVFLGNFMYWDGKQADKEEGYIFKNGIDILSETGLKRSRQENARQILKDAGILEEKKEDFPPKVYYKFNWAQLDKILTDYTVLQNPSINIEELIKGAPDELKNKKTKLKPPKLEKPSPSILFQMREVFDEVYETHPGFQVGYEWSRDKKGGKDWRNLKMLRDAFINRAIHRKKKELILKNETIPESIIIADEELLISWKLFLQNLSPYRIKTSFTPALLYKDFNKIIQEIWNDTTKKQSVNTAGDKPGARSKAEDYA